MTQETFDLVRSIHTGDLFVRRQKAVGDFTYHAIKPRSASSAKRLLTTVSHYPHRYSWSVRTDQWYERVA